MNYSNDRRRTLARGALASSRSAPSWRRDAHQVERSRVRDEIRGLEIALAAGGDLEDLDGFDADRESHLFRAEIAEIVERRRRADNLGALWKWAAAQLRRHEELWSMDVGPADIGVWCRSKFPDTVAGRHAADHAADFIVSRRLIAERLEHTRDSCR